MTDFPRETPLSERPASLPARACEAMIYRFPPTHSNVRAAKSRPAEEALDRDGLVRALVAACRLASPGTVLSVEGPWGSGKTHVLHHVATQLSSPPQAPEHQTAPGRIYWLNPWQETGAGLLPRLVQHLLDDADGLIAKHPGLTDTTSSQSEITIDFGRLLRTILPGLLHLTLNGAGLAWKLGTGAPLGELLVTSAGAVANLVQRLIDDAHRPELPCESLTDQQVNDIAARARALLAATASSDPIRQSMEAIAALAHQVRVLAHAAGEPYDKLYVFVDDIDRCLPNVQLSILEVLYFLTQAGEGFVFLVAIDPTVLAESLRSQYRSSALDFDGYLQKLFDIRVPLAPDTERWAGGLLSSRLRRVFHSEVLATLPSDVLQRGATSLGRTFPSATPRSIHRTCDRLWLAHCAGAQLADLLNPLTLATHHLLANDSRSLAELAGLPNTVLATLATANRGPAHRSLRDQLAPALAERFVSLTDSDWLFPYVADHAVGSLEGKTLDDCEARLDQWKSQVSCWRRFDYST